MRNIFLEKLHTKCGGDTKHFPGKSYTKCGGDALPRHFSKKSNLSISFDRYFIRFVFIVLQAEDYPNILKISCRPLAFTSNKAFLKNKKWSGTSLPASFSV